MNWSAATGIGQRQGESSDSGWASMASNAVKKRTSALREKNRKKISLRLIFFLQYSYINNKFWQYFGKKLVSTESD
jgi:hypothetical protein